MWYRFRAEARHGWRAWLAVGVLVGLGSGAVLALIAGARRTDSAIDRFATQANAWDVLVISGTPGLFDFAEVDLEQVAALPGVADAAPVFVLAVEAKTSGGVRMGSESFNFSVDPAGRVSTELDRVKILEGRPADPADPAEVIVSFRTAELAGLDVGETISATFLSIDALRGDADPAAAPPTTTAAELRVVGIYSTVGELAGSGASSGTPADVRLTPPAFERHRHAAVIRGLVVVLASGPREQAAFLRGVDVLSGGQQVFTLSQSTFARTAHDAVRPVSRALVIGAVLLGIVVLLLGGQALARQAAAEAGDDPTLVALGFTGRRLAAVRGLKAVAIGVVAALVAAAVALPASSLFPIGLAALIEPDPGIRPDTATLAWGFPVIALAFTALGSAAGRWSTRRTLAPAPQPRRHSPARTERLLAGLSARPPVVAGVRAAQRGGSGGGVSASKGAIALGLVASVGAMAFGASLDHLTDSPALYGWNWDVRLGQDLFSSALSAEQLATVREDPALAALAVGAEADVELGGLRQNLLGLDKLVGEIEPSLISGRAATDRGEVVVAPGVGVVGEQLTATSGDARTELRVVGVAALPDVGAVVTLDTLRRIVPGAPTQLALARVSDPSELRAFVERATAALGLSPDDTVFPKLSEEVANFGRVERLPLVLAALMGLVAMGTLLHTLLLSVGRRRRELAILKVLGFTRRQVLVTVATHASTLTAVSLAMGVPLGIGAGRLLWLRFADGLGVVPVAVVPVLATGLVVALSLVVANLASTIPGLRAARTPAAGVLRSE